MEQPMKYEQDVGRGGRSSCAHAAQGFTCVTHLPRCDVHTDLWSTNTLSVLQNYPSNHSTQSINNRAVPRWDSAWKHMFCTVDEGKRVKHLRPNQQEFDRNLSSGDENSQTGQQVCLLSSERRPELNHSDLRGRWIIDPVWPESMYHSFVRKVI